ncbi:hypothetical protein EZY14_001030 [Kordia sp. TARA_039_SRF]|nr:hypothetical protein EZY14_001030 [Kordia sp. TARA_039_SRF]
MKSLKLKKVKISSIGNTHILFGGATTETQEQACNPAYTNDLYCKTRDPKDTDCETVTNTTGSLRTDPYQHTNTCDGLGG